MRAGHSLGGMTAIAWTGATPERPRRVRALGLFNTSCQEACAGALAHRPRLARVAAAVNRATIAAPVALPSRRSPVSHRLVRLCAHGPQASPSHVALNERLFLACPADVRAGFGRTLGPFDLTEPAAGIDVPSVVVLGERDRLVPPRFSRHLAGTLPDARLVELSDVGHQAPLEAHQQVTALIRELAALE